jgi:hypothetical protein
VLSKTSHLPACMTIICWSLIYAHYWPSRRSTYESTQGSSHRGVTKGSQGISSTGPTSLERKLNVHVHTHTEKSMPAETSRDGSVRSIENQVEEKLDDPRELV